MSSDAKHVPYLIFLSREFVVSLSYFSNNGDLESKMKFAFNVFDKDGNGNISLTEFIDIMKSVLFLSESQGVFSLNVSNRVESRS